MKLILFIVLWIAFAALFIAAVLVGCREFMWSDDYEEGFSEEPERDGVSDGSDQVLRTDTEKGGKEGARP